MSQTRDATLRLVALDAYHVQLISTMLDRLRSRLDRDWRVHDAAGADPDAELIDVDSERGRRHLDERLRQGYDGSTIALGGLAAAACRHRLEKPLRLHPLLSVLGAVGMPAPGEAAASPVRLRLGEWPELDAFASEPDDLRVLAVLARRALTAMELARLLDVPIGRVESVLARLDARGVLLRSTPEPAPPSATDASTPSPPAGLIAKLRRRFGL